MKKKNYLIWIVGLAAGLLLTGCSVFLTPTEEVDIPTAVVEESVTAEGNLVPADYIMLSFGVAGQVSEVLVDEGEWVEEGEVLARIGDTETLEAQVMAANLALLQAQQALDNLTENADLITAQTQIDLVTAQQALVAAEQAWDLVDTDDFREKLDDARVEMEDAKADLEDAQTDLEEYADLDEDNPSRKVAEDAVEEAQQAYDEARWPYEALQNQYDLAEAQLTAAQEALAEAQNKAEATADGPDPDDLALATAQLDQAQSQQVAAAKALTEAELIAPMAGKLVQLDLTVGQKTGPGNVIAVLIDDSQWFVETNDLTEDEVVKIAEGQEVQVTFDALPGETFRGEVESIGETFQERYGDITYVVRIRLLDSADNFRWGMTAEVEFPE
jgi:multidrug resistance efflux pump